MTDLKRIVIFMGLALIICRVDAESTVNDFPTKVRAEYVFACMSSNGESEMMLNRCSCSIDAIAEVMSYDEYVNAETILRMRQLSGERINVFRNAEWTNRVIDAYRKAQAEAEIRCF